MDFLKEYWPLVAALISYVAWLVRLESRVNTLDNLRKDDLRSAKEARENTSATLEKLESQITNRFDHVDQKIDAIFTEVRGDIKTLISQVYAGTARAPRRSASK